MAAEIPSISEFRSRCYEHRTTGPRSESARGISCRPKWLEYSCSLFWACSFLSSLPSFDERLAAPRISRSKRSLVRTKCPDFPTLEFHPQGISLAYRMTAPLRITSTRAEGLRCMSGLEADVAASLIDVRFCATSGQPAATSKDTRN